MSEFCTPTNPRHDSRPERTLERRIDALARGECTEEEFLRETLDAPASAAQSPWDVLAFIDQRYRRGQLPGPVFQALQSKIGRRTVDDRCDGVTIEMFPPAPPSNADTCLPAATASPVAAGGTEASPPPSPPHAGSSPECEAPASSAPSMSPQAAAAAPPAVTIGIGTVLRGRYTLESLLGRGGMGDVYKASDGLDVPPTDADRQVAVKVLRARVSERPELLANLRREFECTRKLSHPNIVKVYELDRDGDLAFYTMEPLDGERLSDVIERSASGGLPRSYAWAVIGAVGAALAHAHSRNVIHGDVSPKNIMVTRSGEVRVLDFGSSRMSDGTDRAARGDATGGVVAVTPEYASCELLEGRQADPRDDLFALACLAYELLAGSHPFAGRRATEARLLGRPVGRPARLSFTEWRALQRGLSWSRAGRPSSIGEWLMRLGLEPEPQRRLAGTLAGRAGTNWRVRLPPPLGVLALAGLFGAALAWQAARGPAERLQTAVTPRANAQRDASPAEEPLPGASAATGDPAPPPGAPATPPAAPEASGARPAQAPAPASISVHDPPKAARQQVATANPHAHRDPVIAFTAHPYSVHRGQNFAEVHLWRSRAEEAAGGFVWWTEDLSARGGTDFQPQPLTPHSFAAGRQFTTLFVRLVPNATRTQTTRFHVCVGRPRGPSEGLEVNCSTIALPATRRTVASVPRG